MGFLDRLGLSPLPDNKPWSSSQKRKRGNMSGIPAQTKQPKYAYAPEAYMNSGYGGAGSVVVTEDEDDAGIGGSGYTPTEMTGRKKKNVKKPVVVHPPNQDLFVKAVQSNILLKKAEEKWVKGGPGKRLGTLEDIKKQRMLNDRIIEAVAKNGMVPSPEAREPAKKPKTPKTAETTKKPKTMYVVVPSGNDEESLSSNEEEEVEVEPQPVGFEKLIEKHKPSLDALQNFPPTAPPPAGGKTQPAVGKTQPAGAKTQPAGAKTHPTGARTHPTGGKTQPAVGKTRPAVGKTQPTAGKTQPEITNPSWDLHPNTRARVLGDKKLILAEIGEPEYACRDVEIRDAIWQVMDRMERFAKQHFDEEVDNAWTRDERDGIVSEYWYMRMGFDTVKLIHCVASGGPLGVYGWHDIFLNEKKRRALVCAIIGKIITEQVFQHPFFGGSKENLKRIADSETKLRDDDGFVRHRFNALYIRSVLQPTQKSKLTLPPKFTSHVNAVLSALWVHLSHLYSLVNAERLSPTEVLVPLHTIITQAALVSLHMRLDPHTVYHHAPMFKEDNFDGDRMECFNIAELDIENPHKELAKCPPEEQVRRARLSAAERKRSKGDSLVTAITILDGVTAYRLGGWEAPHSRPSNVVYERDSYKNKGVRTRVLTHGWVYCRWGRARSVQKPAADAEVNEEEGRKLHGDSWREGGWLGFTDSTPGKGTSVAAVRGGEAVEQPRSGVESLSPEVEQIGSSEAETGSSLTPELETGSPQVDQWKLAVKKVDKGKGRADMASGPQSPVVDSWNLDLDPGYSD
ncbi:Atrophin-1 multi-domain protein [Pyrenophora tritici-repentis]|uniref:Atrophin-1 multi-domain protein n=1 Tax=Pyrenophora tritici-repentis TaxID=45151 RepID=A0A317ANW2_9PLEO|nr:Atrophin-1 multi-domain protein [Pyrenophora tritici-repentis]